MSPLSCIASQESIAPEVPRSELFGGQLSSLLPAPATHEPVEIGAADSQLTTGMECPEFALVEPPPDRSRRDLGVSRRISGRHQFGYHRLLGECCTHAGIDLHAHKLCDRTRQACYGSGRGAESFRRGSLSNSRKLRGCSPQLVGERAARTSAWLGASLRHRDAAVAARLAARAHAAAARSHFTLAVATAGERDHQHRDPDPHEGTLPPRLDVALVLHSAAGGVPSMMDSCRLRSRSIRKSISTRRGSRIR